MIQASAHLTTIGGVAVTIVEARLAGSDHTTALCALGSGNLNVLQSLPQPPQLEGLVSGFTCMEARQQHCGSTGNTLPSLLVGWAR
jgi:hypothetical protein